MSIRKDFQKNWNESKLYVKAVRVIMLLVLIPFGLMKLIGTFLEFVADAAIDGVAWICRGGNPRQW